MSASRRLSIGLIVIGVTLGGVCASPWAPTKNLVAFETPVSLSRGHIEAGPFGIRLRSGYNVGIVVDPNRLFAQDCHGAEQCHESLANLEAHWQLSNSGTVKKSGDAEATGNRSGDLAILSWPLGILVPWDGRYTITLDVLSDTGGLSVGNPVLFVQADQNGIERLSTIETTMEAAALVSVCLGIALLFLSRSRPKIAMNWTE